MQSDFLNRTYVRETKKVYKVENKINDGVNITIQTSCAWDLLYKHSIFYYFYNVIYLIYDMVIDIGIFSDKLA